MKLVRALAAALVLAGFLSVPSSPVRLRCAAAQESPSAPEATWVRDRLAVAIPMRDGAKLAADVFLPPKPGRYPTVVIQTPYDRTRQRGALGNAPGGFGDSAGLGGFVDREHYAYVVVDWRGFFGSKGAGRAAGVDRLGRDGHDVVEWTASQEWCDGKVGTWGPSALGVVQYQTAAAAPPHLVCAVPVVAAYGYRYEDYYERGVLRDAHVSALDRLGFGTGSVVRQARTPDAPVYRLAAAAERSASVDVPMLFVTGWLDISVRRTLATFARFLREAGPRCREGSRLLAGPWHHMAVDQPRQGEMEFPWAAGEAARETRAFFDRHLRGVGTEAWDARPRVRFARIGETGWIGAPEWPREGGTLRAFALRADGSIVAAPAAGEEPPRSVFDDPDDPVPTLGGANLPFRGLIPGPQDQTPLLARRDVLVYSTAPLQEPLRIEGEVAVEVVVLVDAPDTDVAVRLCIGERPRTDGATGRTMLLADGIARASYTGRSGAPFDVLVPGEPRRVRIELPPLAVTIGEGERLVVIVAGTNHPRFERNGHTGAPAFDEISAVAAKVEFLHGAGHAPRVVLPIAPPAAK